MELSNLMIGVGLHMSPKVGEMKVTPEMGNLEAWTQGEFRARVPVLQTPIVHRFLRLFTLYKDLWTHCSNLEDQVEEGDKRLEEAASARIAAEDDARFWKSKADAAEAAATNAQMEVLTSIKKVANYEALRSGMFTVPFPEVYSAPPQPTENTEESESPVLNTARSRQQVAVQKSRSEAKERRRKFRESLDLGEVQPSTLDSTTN